MLRKPLWKRLTGRLAKKSSCDQSSTVISRSNHSLSRQQINPNALKVLYRLQKKGFAAYLVGGGVRDLLLQRKPKDFDVATDALPEEVRDLFSNSRIIGRRFRLVHVYFYGEIIEVSTFRANLQDDDFDINEPVKIRADNEYGTIEEDAWRRDFTVNALYYNIADFSIVDYAGGMSDLHNKTIAMLGDPIQRFHEDPVRLLRALRLSAKLGFEIDDKMIAPIRELSHLLQHVPPARLFDEMIKLFFEGYAQVNCQQLKRYDYFSVLFPGVQQAFSEQEKTVKPKLIQLAMRATDQRFKQGKSLNPGFLLSVIVWPVVQQRMSQKKKTAKPFHLIFHSAMDEALSLQNETLRIPKRLSAMMRSVWVLQYYLQRRRPKRIISILRHRYFRAAYDFLKLRVETGEPYKEQMMWWQSIQKVSREKQRKMISKL